MSLTQASAFGTLLKQYRLAADFSQETLAAQSGVSADAISMRMLAARERDEQALPDATLDDLRGKRRLLVLDNYELIVAAALLLTDLCEGSLPAAHRAGDKPRGAASARRAALSGPAAASAHSGAAP